MSARQAAGAAGRLTRRMAREAGRRAPRLSRPAGRRLFFFLRALRVSSCLR